MDTPTMDTPTEAAPTEENEPVHFPTGEVPGDVDRSGPIFVRARCSWCNAPTVLQQGDVTTMLAKEDANEKITHKREGDVVKMKAPCRECGTDYVVGVHAPQGIERPDLQGEGALTAPEARA